jgi:5-methylcytosine-specific restriction endonuclease McrA
MPWDNTPEKRQQDAKTYGDPVYKRNRAIVLRQAAGRCSECGHRHRLQVDHVIPVSQGGGHTADNLRALCAGDGTCQCHERKTAQEGGGYRRNPPGRAPRDPKPRPRTQW